MARVFTSNHFPGNASPLQFAAKRPMEHRRQERVQFGLCGVLQGGQFVRLGLQGVQVGDDAVLFWKGRNWKLKLQQDSLCEKGPC